MNGTNALERLQAVIKCESCGAARGLDEDTTVALAEMETFLVVHVACPESWITMTITGAEEQPRT